MKNFLESFVILFFMTLTTSCINAPIVASIDSANTQGSTTTSIIINEYTPTPEDYRYAVFSEIENEVWMRQTKQSDFVPAEAGQQLHVGGETHTGEFSMTRLDLMPEGSIIRLGSSSSFVLENLDQEEDPFTRLILWIGSLWIQLSGGELEVSTNSGVASVRGSYLSVSFDPNTLIMNVYCLEGFCSIENAWGIVELTGGQASAILGLNLPPLDPRMMTPEEIQDWLDNNPELLDKIDDIPFLQEWLEQPTLDWDQTPTPWIPTDFPTIWFTVTIEIPTMPFP